MTAVVGLLLGLGPWAWGLQGSQTPREVIAEVRVHGNHVSSDEEVIKLSGVTIGEAFGPTTIADVTARLKSTGKFDDVQVLKRFASIEDPTRIVIMIVVNEGAVRIVMPKDPTAPARVEKRGAGRNLMRRKH